MSEIRISGTIVSDEDKFIYDWLGIDATCPADLRQSLEEANGDDVTIVINSGGGDLFAGVDMNYSIGQYAGKTTVDITGLAASAATLVACGADVVRAHPGAQYMIHNVASHASGDYNDMDHMSDILKNANVSISNIYRQKTGLDEKSLLKLMNAETWMDSKQALAYGFVDEIIGEKVDSTISLYNGVATILSDETKAKLRAQLTNQSEQTEGEETPEEAPAVQADNHEREYAELELLKLKGGQRHD